jgi:hypothetical protein
MKKYDKEIGRSDLHDTGEASTQLNGQTKIIQSLKPKKSSGYYEITSETLKTCASLISHPLSYIYNRLIYTGIFSDCLKIAGVKLMYKILQAYFIINCFLYGILESHHLHTNNILATEQYGFGKKISTENAAFRLKDSNFYVCTVHF